MLDLPWGEESLAVDRFHLATRFFWTGKDGVLGSGNVGELDVGARSGDATRRGMSSAVTHSRLERQKRRETKEEQVGLLLKTYRLEEVDGPVELGLLLCSVPPELLAHDLDDTREGVDGSIDADEGQLRATSDEVRDVLSEPGEGRKRNTSGGMGREKQIRMLTRIGRRIGTRLR